VPDIAASFQAAATDVQVHKIARAAREKQVDRVALAGGVAANQDLRRQLKERLRADGRELYFPGLALCTDNAAMVAYLGERKLLRGETADLELDAATNLTLPSD
jgi:N6-L-threonylcarbamoyladenine synthase